MSVDAVVGAAVKRSPKAIGTGLLSGDEVMGVDAPWPLRASLADWSVMAKAWAQP